MSDVVTRAEGLAKKYVIGHQAERESYTTLRDVIARGARRRLRATMDMFRGQAIVVGDTLEEFWALKDVSFEVKRGEVVGIIGRNGAGKSTLLKILSRITEPSAGRVTIRGRVSSLLEVGTGFHPELTGRENVYLNGAILGMTRAEISRKFDEIVAFAEVEKFLDTPVKRYSSGMYVRLAFAVAAHLEPDILLLDEVLAVGDAAFQRKCLGKMGEVARQGRTVLFVSHNMAAISRFCPRCVWLDEGRVRLFDDSTRVVAEYLAVGSDDAGEVTFPLHAAPGSDNIRLLAVRTKNGRGEKAALLASNEPVTIEIEYQTLRDTIGLRVGLHLVTADGAVLLSTKDLDVLPEDLRRPAGRYKSSCELPPDFFNTGQYFVSVGADFPMVQSHFSLDRLLSFQIEAVGGAGGHIPDGRLGFIRMKFPWVVEQLDDAAAITQR
jgi:lipopolysaccharide transport system ATP-binding protein